MAVVPRAKPFALDLSNTDDLKIVLPKVMHDINFMLEELYSDLAAVGAQFPITEASLSLSDVTTDNVSTTKHGFIPRLPNDSTKFFNGVGAFSAPSTSSLDTVITSSATGAQNNFAPGLSGNTFVELTGAAPAISGLAGGVTGQLVVFKNTGTGVATFLHQNGLSSAGNLFTNLVTSGPTPVAAGGWAAFIYDGSNWMLVDHEQGAWITPAFSAANFTASGAMTWTVASGNVTTYKYRISGKTMQVGWFFQTTTIGGTPSFALRVNAFGYTIATRCAGTHYKQNSPTDTGFGPASFENVAGQPYFQLYTDQNLGNSLNWSASTNTSSEGFTTIELQ